MTIDLDPVVVNRAGRRSVDHADALSIAARGIDFGPTTVADDDRRRVLAERVCAVADRMRDNGEHLLALLRDTDATDCAVGVRFSDLVGPRWR